ncbi:homocysteine S-methyltransferase [Ancylostoma ceylanicum]|uniref:Homocysteine S-methyltransferase n=1 Tax=Ancylostoma ceylanicum TaxID=53326 RepID=A0A0D6LXZ2_9BILA|nr:homocysteine S-methyltransferase [Ancylostoma ceylanicum]
MARTSKKVRVLDGSFATELSNVVKDYFVEERPNWTFDAVMTHPGAVITVHRRFIDAGADDITTNTYHASLSSLVQQGLDGPGLIAKAVSMLKEAIATQCPNDGRRIWGSIGSYAICLRGLAAEYTASFIDTSPAEEILKTMTDYHREQVKAMVAAGQSHILFETVSSLMEAQAICDALSLSSCDDVKAVDGFSVRHGEAFVDAVRLVLSNPKVVGFGVNCTHPKAVTSLLESVQSLVSNKEVFVYPNSGKYESEVGEESAMKIILNSVEKWVELGVTVIGGCCGLDARDISEIRKQEAEHQNYAQQARTFSTLLCVGYGLAGHGSVLPTIGRNNAAAAQSPEDVVVDQKQLNI